MPPYVKGGVWTNVEDEVLKAGIAKYGLNQWGRVSTLLNTKTSKQCKARWYQWLDPSVKKSEWTREEDEKLLTYAKILPNQWQAIARYVDRTTSQCIERYRKLLNDAMDADALASDPASMGKLRAGDIDPNPESKPAKPDAVDMDDEEKEMLSEARARLANTQGKKARRRDRERLLEESHRLSLIHKRREMRISGVNTNAIKRKKKKSEIDYASEIPFERKPAPGLYDTSEEQEMNEREKLKYDQKVQSKGLQFGQDKKRKKQNDPEQKKSAAEQAAQARIEKLQHVDVQDQLAKRRKLDLPAPQVKDDEIAHVIKQGKRQQDIREELGDQDFGYGDNDELPAAQQDVKYSAASSAHHEQDAIRDDTLNRRLQDLQALGGRKSALYGGDETELNDDSYEVPMRGQSSAGIELRNVEEQEQDFKLPSKSSISELKKKFAALPKPKNDFEIALPEDEDEEMDQEEQEDQEEQPQDRGEQERKIAERQEIERQKQLKRRSQVIQRGLPFPTKIELSKMAKAKASKYPEIEEMVIKELEALIVSDSVKYFSGSLDEGGTALDDLDDDLKTEVENEIKSELTLAQKSEPKYAMLQDAEIKCSLPGIEGYDADVEDQVTNALTESAGTANKVEKKLGLVFGGYVKRQATLKAKLEESYNELLKARQEANVYQELADAEQIAIHNRQSELQSEVDFLTEHERAGQERFKYLQSIKEGLV